MSPGYRGSETNLYGRKRYAGNPKSFPGRNPPWRRNAFTCKRSPAGFFKMGETVRENSWERNRRENPDVAVLLDEQEKKRAAVDGSLASAPSEGTLVEFARGVVTPAVIAALSTTVFHAAARELHVAVRAAIQQRCRSAVFPAKENDFFSEQRHACGACLEIFRSRGYVPGVSRKDMMGYRLVAPEFPGAKLMLW